MKAQSQQDTTVYLCSQKDFFEYSLTSLGEQNLEDIKANVKTSESQLNSLSLMELEQLNNTILSIQSEFFTDEQIAQLFDEKNRLRQLAIDKLTIRETQLDANSQQQMLKKTSPLT